VGQREIWASLRRLSRLPQVDASTNSFAAFVSIVMRATVLRLSTTRRTLP
jgi:hypothetical protein